MKKVFVVFFTLSLSLLYAQKHEIGVFVGGANLIGDIGRSNYINPLPVDYNSGSVKDKVPIALGVIYRFNLNPQMGLRFNGMYGRVIGDDRTSSESYKKERDYRYKNSIYETSIVFEYNFFDINKEQRFAHSPYIFAGVGLFWTNEAKNAITHQFYRDEDGNPITPMDPQDFETTMESKNKTKMSWTVPFGAGYKVKFKFNWVLSAEVGFRPTSSDKLDFSFASTNDFTSYVEPELRRNPVYKSEIDERNKELITSRQVGNTSNKDWYVFTGLTLTYTFGRPPCYCE